MRDMVSRLGIWFFISGLFDGFYGDDVTGLVMAWGTSPPKAAQLLMA